MQEHDPLVIEGPIESVKRLVAAVKADIRTRRQCVVECPRFLLSGIVRRYLEGGAIVFFGPQPKRRPLPYNRHAPVL